MQNPTDYSYIHMGRRLEVECVEGGARMLGPSSDELSQSDLTSERVGVIASYYEVALNAYQQRGLTYPFTPSARGDSFTVLPGQRRSAKKSAELGQICGLAHPASKSFESRSFKALWSFMGGKGYAVGFPRTQHGNLITAVCEFRKLLAEFEKGDYTNATCSTSGDHGADGFIILGSSWGGPIVYFQAKNSDFDLRDIPQEFTRTSHILNEWYGRRIDQVRKIVPVFAVNTVFTIKMKETIFEQMGDASVHIIDAVDILLAEQVQVNTFSSESQLLAM